MVFQYQPGPLASNFEMTSRVTPGDEANPSCAALPSTSSHIHVSGTLAGLPIAVLGAVLG